MLYASIMVAVDLGEHARDRIRLAAHLAENFQARLIGVAAEMPPYQGAPAGPTPGSAYFIPAIQEAVLNDLRLAHEIFDQTVAGRCRVEWRSTLDFPLAFLTLQAAGADLIVIGRDRDGNLLLSVNAGDAVTELGRPVLVVPPNVDHIDAKSVVVAWKNTREARRAVWDALPFLTRASHVIILSIDEGNGAADGQDVVRLLQAHNINAKTDQLDARGAATAEALIDAASAHGADLIVAGAYGHSRMREWAFGGVTRDLLTSSPICCLMSH